jgi:uncharacterized membrane protein YbaN (DUF454 family)
MPAARAAGIPAGSRKAKAMVESRPPESRCAFATLRRHALIALAWMLAALGVVGFFIPLVPGVFFLILAAICAAKSCPALRQRIFAMPRVGGDVEAFVTYGTMRPAAKRAALAGMTAAGIVTAAAVGPDSIVSWSAIFGLGLGAAYVATRPTAGLIVVEDASKAGVSRG